MEAHSSDKMTGEWEVWTETRTKGKDEWKRTFILVMIGAILAYDGQSSLDFMKQAIKWIKNWVWEEKKWNSEKWIVLKCESTRNFTSAAFTDRCWCLNAIIPMAVTTARGSAKTPMIALIYPQASFIFSSFHRFIVSSFHRSSSIIVRLHRQILICDENKWRK